MYRSGTLLAVCLLLFGGCTYHTVTIDPSEYELETAIQLPGSAVETYFPSPRIDSVNFIFLAQCGTNTRDRVSYQELIVDFLHQLGFNVVYDAQQLGSYLSKNNLDGIVSSLSDKSELGKLDARIGPFFVIQNTCTHLGNAIWLHTFVIHDPRDGKDVLKISYRRKNMISAEREVMYPVYNKVLEWAKESRRLFM